MKIKFIIMKLQNTTWKLIDQLLSKILGAGNNFFLQLVDFYRSKTFDNVFIGCEIMYPPNKVKIWDQEGKKGETQIGDLRERSQVTSVKMTTNAVK